VHFNHGDPNKDEPVATQRDQTAAYFTTGSDHGKPRNVEFNDFEYGRNNSDGNEFHDAEDENFQELGSTLSAEVSGDSNPIQGERVMLNRWFNEPVKDGPYLFHYYASRD
jgi:hypothetical protein